MRRVLVLRPEPGASATAERARELGLDPFVVPLFKVSPLAWEAPDPRRFDGLLFTSANAVRCGGDPLRRLGALPVYAVGDASASAAREAGFDVVAVGDGGVDRLLEAIPAGLRLLHPCGEHRREASRARQAITSVPVYVAAAIEAPDLSAARGSVALVHSPRAGRRLAALAHDRSATRIAAISTAAAEAAGTGWQAVEVADSPNDDALLALAARLCNKPALE